LEAAKLVYDIDPIIEKVVNSLREHGKDLLEAQRRKEEELKKKGVLGFFSKKDKAGDNSGASQL
jgi:hypothetical protein